jgi:hypothetical protein
MTSQLARIAIASVSISMSQRYSVVGGARTHRKSERHSSAPTLAISHSRTVLLPLRFFRAY